MPSLATLLGYAWRRPTVTLRINGRRCSGVVSVEVTQEVMQGLATSTVEVVDPPVTPVGGMAIAWTWGLSRVEVPGFTGYILRPEQASYPPVWRLSCADALWPASVYQADIATDPLNEITAKAAIEYILGLAGITRIAPVAGLVGSPGTARKSGMAWKARYR